MTETSSFFDPDVLAHSLQHLADYLYRAKQPDRLFALATDPRWYQRSLDFDTSRVLFSTDVDWAVRGIVEATNDVSPQFQTSRGTNLARLAALAWLSAHLGQSANQIPVSALEALARVGDAASALKSASLIPDEQKRVEALINIGLGAFEGGAIAYADVAWRQAQELLLSMSTDFFYDRFVAWAHLVRVLARAQRLSEAATVVAELSSELERQQNEMKGAVSSAYIALAGAWGAIGHHHAAIAAANKLTDPASRMKALIVAAENRPQPDQTWVELFLSQVRELIPSFNEPGGRILIARFLAWAGQRAEAERMAEHNPSASDKFRILWAMIRGHSAETSPGLLTEASQQFFATAADEARMDLLNELALSGEIRTCFEVFPEISAWLKAMSPTLLNPQHLGLAALQFAYANDTESVRAILAKIGHCSMITERRLN